MKKPYPEAFSLNGLLLLALLGIGVWFIYQRFDNHNWPETTGRIVENWIDEHEERDEHNHVYNTYYTVGYDYVYLVEKVSYQGTGNSIMSYYRKHDAEKAQKSDFYKGNHIRVIYNPKHPNESNLYRHPF